MADYTLLEENVIPLCWDWLYESVAIVRVMCLCVFYHEGGKKSRYPVTMYLGFTKGASLLDVLFVFLARLAPFHSTALEQALMDHSQGALSAVNQHTEGLMAATFDAICVANSTPE